MPKPKVVVRFRPGASGNFLTCILLSLVESTVLKNPLSGHENFQAASLAHNFEDQYLNDEFDIATSVGSDLIESTKYIKQNFFIHEKVTETPFVTIITHTINPEPILLAFENSRLINIHHTAQETDQILYNFVLKTLADEFFFVVPKLLDRFKKMYPGKLTTVTHIDKDNIHLMMYIQKFLTQSTFNDFIQYSTAHPNLNIAWKSIIDKSIISRIEELASFVGIDINQERYNNAVELINKYSDAQQTIIYNGPTVTFEDFN
jgi:hypothetical protein